MALSGSFSRHPISGSNFGLVCTWTATQDYAAVSSTITLKTYLRYYTITVAARTDSNYTEINGVRSTYSTTSISDSTGAWTDRLLNTRSYTVAHNGDGTKSVVLTGMWNANITYSGTYIDDLIATTTVTLDPISVNSAPTLPGWFSSGGSLIQESAFNFSWGAGSDAQGNTITYNLYCNSYYNADWGQGHDSWLLIASTTGTSASFNITGYPRGMGFQFWMTCTDGSLTSTHLYPTDMGSAMHARNRAPYAPGWISPGEGVYEGSIPVSWGAASDPDGHGIGYALEVSTNWGAWANVGLPNPYATSYSYVMPAHAGNTAYRFRVRTWDSQGAVSDFTTAGGDCYKNSPPSAPGSVGPGSGYYENAIWISWGGSSDANGDSVTYTVEASVNDGGYFALASGLGGLGHNFDITPYARDPQTRFRFRVKARDSRGGESGYTTSGGYCYRNRLPSSPVLHYPAAGKSVYSRQPRLLISLGTDQDYGHTQSLLVYWNGTWYNSANGAHQSCFSRTGSGLAGGSQLVFLPPSPCAVGSVTVKLKASDGYGESLEKTATITVASDNLLSLVDGQTKISADLFNRIRTATNVLRGAYGIAAASFTDPVLAADMVPKKIWFTEIRDRLLDVVNGINGWDNTGSVHDVTFIQYPMAATEPILECEHLAQLYNLIQTM